MVSLVGFFAPFRYSKLSGTDKDIYDDEASLLKHSLDDHSSTDSSLEKLTSHASDRNRYLDHFFVFNVLFFGLSIFLFTISTIASSDPYLLRERNYFLKQTSEPCKSLHVSSTNVEHD